MRSILTNLKLINFNPTSTINSKFSSTTKILINNKVNTNITLFTAGTPNGQKASITLEVLDLTYKVRAINLSKNEQKEDWFLKINPNGRIPAIIDHSNNDFAVFESGAIMLYLAQNYDPEHKLWPRDSKLQSEVIQWLMFQMGGIGPMQGQANHFLRAAPEKIQYGIDRYINETKRLYSVIEGQLRARKYLVGEQFTIADIANFTWVSKGNMLNINFDEFPNIKDWIDRIGKSSKVIKGLKVPSS